MKNEHFPEEEKGSMEIERVNEEKRRGKSKEPKETKETKETKEIDNSRFERKLELEDIQSISLVEDSICENFLPDTSVNHPIQFLTNRMKQSLVLYFCMIKY